MVNRACIRSLVIIASWVVANKREFDFMQPFSGLRKNSDAVTPGLARGKTDARQPWADICNTVGVAEQWESEERGGMGRYRIF